MMVNVTTTSGELVSVRYDMAVVPHQWLPGETAVLTIVNTHNVSLTYSWQNSDCYSCAMFTNSYLLQPGQNCSQRVMAGHASIMNFSFLLLEPPIHRSKKLKFRDSGQYAIGADAENGFDPFVMYDNGPRNADLLVLWLFLFFLGLATVWVILTKLHHRGYFKRFEFLFFFCYNDTDSPPSSAQPSGARVGQATSNGTHGGTSGAYGEVELTRFGPPDDPSNTSVTQTTTTKETQPTKAAESTKPTTNQRLVFWTPSEG